MPIKGITDRPRQGFPMIGELRKGAPKGANRPGADLDHFRFTASIDKEALEQDFRDKYGDKPRSFRVTFLGQLPVQVFEAWREEWTGSSLVHRCDGERVVLQLDQGTNKYIQNPGSRCDNTKCQPRGRLSVWLPELERAGLVTVLTSSIHDIGNLQAQLDAAMSLQGDLRRIPFILSRNPRSISVPSNGKRMRVEKWLLSLEIEPAWFGMKLHQSIALPEVENVPQITETATEGLTFNVDVDTGEVEIPLEVEVVEAPVINKPKAKASPRMLRLETRYKALCQEARTINKHTGKETIAFTDIDTVDLTETALTEEGRGLADRINGHRSRLGEVQAEHRRVMDKHGKLFRRCKQLGIDANIIDANTEVDAVLALNKAMETQIAEEEANSASTAPLF